MWLLRYDDDFIVASGASRQHGDDGDGDNDDDDDDDNSIGGEGSGLARSPWRRQCDCCIRGKADGLVDGSGSAYGSDK